LLQRLRESLIAGCAALAAGAGGLALAQENPATALEGPAVHVVGIRPVPGLGTPLRDIPSAVQSTTARDVEQSQPLDVSDYLARSFAGVHVGDSEGNPFQQSLGYRGFTASPLLGLPQGLSVFVDGVRVNEPFGDTVNWDLVAPNTIANMHLLSGTNPVFGLNTLGGVLSIHTKSGFAFPGTEARLGGGSFGRRSLEAETGGHGERTDYFAAVRAYDDSGWREHSPSRLRQAFVKSGWQDARTDLDVSLSAADNTLQGTQALPVSMLGNPRQAYTWPDIAENQLSFLTVRASRSLDNDVLLSGNLYVRALRQNSVASNVNDDLTPPGFNDRSSVEQTSTGLTVQAVRAGRFADIRHEFTVGAALHGASVDFRQDRQDAAFTDDRDTVGTGPFVPRVDVGARHTYRSIYVMEQLSPSERWTFTVSGRYNVASVHLRDRSGAQPGLDGDHDFHRLTPALGATWNPNAATTWFASASEGMRVPSPVELTCADPTAPCALPNQFLADPALNPVIARTVEGGVRLRPSAELAVSVSAYRTLLSDDIQFVTSGAAVNSGFFQNTGRTVRQGFDVTVARKTGTLSLAAAYSYVRAEYLTPFRMLSPNNSSSDAAGEIQVERGDRIPGIPRSQLKLLGEWTYAPRASIGLGWAWFDRQYLRGDENNRDVHGPLPSYGVAQAFARYRPSRDWQLSLKIDNLFDRRYSSFGLLGSNFFTGPGNTYDPAAATPEQFVAPGAPRSVWLALQYESR
jgi:outer membrane receptor protein involved in Fe transport